VSAYRVFCGNISRLILAAIAVALSAGFAAAQDKKPNILIVFPDDVGWTNISAYGRGVMGYRTPNIDRIAREGAMFTEHYAQPSCTAGRAALITGQYPIRSGMTTVGRPGAELGLKKETPTLAEVLKENGYATGQFGKNHLGDRNEHLPTMHGFDEFFGNLYHLNTEEEPEQVDYPKDPEFKKKYGTRGVLRTKATDVDDPTVDPRFGKVGKQTIEDTGPLTRKRMETMDEEFFAAAADFMKRSKASNKPFFVRLNPSRMHMFTHLRPAHKYLAAPYTTEHDAYGSGLIEHDMQVGKLLDDMKAMGVLDNTIIVYSTDNGPEHSARTHGGTTPFRGEKMTTYEGGVRVPLLVRWPGKIPAGEVLGGIQAHMDIFTTLAAAAGDPDVDPHQSVEGSL
jgi:arylsulfatase A-like enzyme